MHLEKNQLTVKNVADLDTLLRNYATTSEEYKYKMDYNTKVRRNQIIALFLITTFIIGCGGLIGFGNLFKSVLFVLPFFILLLIGGYYIIKHFQGQKQFVLFALWLGFVFAATAIVGMLIDPRTYPINWLKLFVVAGISWLGTFSFVLLASPVYSKYFMLGK